MNKALSWKLGGAGLDAREAAREAARRQGKSIGEWLHGVIADEAADHADTTMQDASSHERIKAVTARLERMGARRASTERQSDERADRGTAAYDGRRSLSGDAASTEDRRRPIADSLEFEGADARLEQAIEAMERSAHRSERRSEDALASLAKVLETSERRRENERAGIVTLARKLAAIDSRLSDRDENPIKESLARLEARLEQIGRRNEAEASARRNTLASTNARDTAEPMLRLEKKLNAVLQAVSSGQRPSQTEISPVAFAAARGETADQSVELPARRLRLGDAIADIADRQRMLDRDSFSEAGKFAGHDTGEIAANAVGDALAVHVDGLRRPLGRPAPAPGERLDFEALRKDIGAMAEQLRGLAPRSAVTAIEGQISQLESRLANPSAAIDGLRADIRQIGGRLDKIEEKRDSFLHKPAQQDGRSGAPLENLVDELGRRIEAVQAPGAATSALDALQSQVGLLAARLESTEMGLASLATIERSMRDLFAHLEETRSLVGTPAARAAQEDVDQRTRATLDVMHETLEKVVDRLAATTEPDLAETLSPASLEEPPTEDEEPPAHRDDPEATPEPTFASPLDETPSAEQSLAPVGADDRFINDIGSGKADFIAAARRAAHAAQTDSSLVALRAPVSEGPSAARAGLMARSRDYVASHKRPVLLALAAVLVAAATMALVQRRPLGSSGQEIAQKAAPVTIAKVISASPTAPANAQFAAARPAPLPRSTPAVAAQVPGSDPTATGSIPSLPAFAAGMAPRAPSEPTLPAGLVKMAEAGNGAAQYALATAYAEGRGTRRDFVRAAKLYAEAASKGIVPAKYRLGALYEKGLGVAQDKARAKALYQQAADAGNPRAMHNLAVLLADGDGKPDYESAASWFRKAAQYGVHDSEFNLAILLARGLGVDQSLVQSYQWFAIAAAQGDSDAASKRDEVGSKLSASELSVAKALAAAYHPHNADPAAVEVAAPPGGWDGDSAPVHLNSGKTKIS